MKMLFCILACFASPAFAISVAAGHAAPAAHASVSAHSSPPAAHGAAPAAHGTTTAHATAEVAPAAARSTSSAAHPVETVPSRPWYMFWRSPVVTSSSTNKCDKDKDPNCK